MYRLAIFDLDGTLADSLRDLAEAVNNSLASFGYPTHTVEAYKYFVGNGAKKLCERALPEDKKTDAEIQRLLTHFGEYYSTHCFDHTVPYDGMQDTVKRLTEAGVICAVASNKPDDFSQIVVERLYGSGLFSLVRGKRDGVPTKPSPDIVYDICRELDIPSGEAVFIGDSCVDVQTAHNAGLPCIGCVWGFRGEQELRDSGCDILAYKPEELFDLIRR
ncbi:MAG: HAD-IA family hydrolase [Ruminococcus sp.]|nr:HAD-IA family hydrolase [Ruminococcus sp.]